VNFISLPWFWVVRTKGARGRCGPAKFGASMDESLLMRFAHFSIKIAICEEVVE
jgi:hypothetical protein